jgi:hypothetical protein
MFAQKVMGWPGAKDARMGSNAARNKARARRTEAHVADKRQGRRATGEGPYSRRLACAASLVLLEEESMQTCGGDHAAAAVALWSSFAGRKPG